MARHDAGPADHFIAHTLARNVRIEQDLLGHLFNLDSTEQRLARALLRLAGYGTVDAPARRGPKLSHERLAHLAGRRAPESTSS